MLAAAPDATDAIVGRVTADPWPLVRVAALDALAGRPEEREVLRGRIRDVSPMVREHAIARLTEQRDEATWPLLAPLFLDDDEWPRVTAAALEYASALCRPDAGDAIEAVMRRGTREGAWAPHVDVAVLALRIAQRLGGDAAERATLMARRSASQDFEPVLNGQGALPACPAPATP
jgi:HEAT repeat protein